MHMRLAFSVATAVRPDVLIVDEALSVGDAYFQHKSMKKIRDFSKEGTTLLFVSHDPGAVKTLCDRAILLDEGIKIREGSPDSVLDYYNAMIARREKDAEIRQIEAEKGRLVTRSGDGRARIISVEMTDENGNPTRAFRVGEKARIICSVECHSTIENPTVGFSVRDRLGNEVFGTNTFHLNLSANSVAKKGDLVRAIFETEINLGCGHYSLSVAVHAGQVHLEGNYDWWDQVLVFQVIPGAEFSFVGSAFLPVHGTLDWSETQQEAFNKYRFSQKGLKTE
jgi:lipopolysaccharide transport system ATP-binding protein